MICFKDYMKQGGPPLAEKKNSEGRLKNVHAEPGSRSRSTSLSSWETPQAPPVAHHGAVSLGCGAPATASGEAAHKPQSAITPSVLILWSDGFERFY